jgi:hypothetical protein
MNRTLLFTFFVCVYTCGTAFAVSPDLLPPTHPCDIITIASRLTIPRLDFREPTTLKEALTFIHTKYLDIDTDPPRETVFGFEYRLPEATLQRRVSFEARNVTMIQALKLALTGIPVALTFEPGKVIFGPPTSRTDAPTSTRKP